MPALWPHIPADHPFGAHHLPYGIFSTPGDPRRRAGVRIGDQVLDLHALATARGSQFAPSWAGPNLNAFLALPASAWDRARAWLQALLTEPADAAGVAGHLVPLADVEMHLAVRAGDYVDFYASEHHASNVGRIFRPDSEPLTPNWKHLPIGYHGRSSTLVVSGAEVRRPQGQRKAPQAPSPTFGPSRKLDIEAELAFVVGGSTAVGQPVPIEAAEQHLFGVALFNDWSARDIQAWEYVPLGPFGGKSFASSMAAWITPMAALGPARVPLPVQDPEPLAYLRGESHLHTGLDIEVQIDLNGTLIARAPYRQMYWSPAQMLTQMTVTGAALRPGDIFASGTISGPGPDQQGSLLELSWNGQSPIELAHGFTRTFLQDGDEVTLRATAPGPHGSPIGLAEVAGVIIPAG